MKIMPDNSTSGQGKYRIVKVEKYDEVKYHVESKERMFWGLITWWSHDNSYKSLYDAEERVKRLLYKTKRTVVIE